MFKHIKRWFGKKLTLIIAPSHGGRSFHLRFSYPFITVMIMIFVTVFYAGVYVTDIYLSYAFAIRTNKALIAENEEYSKKVDETLGLLHNIKGVETQLRGMLGMKSTRKIIENYNVGGPFMADQMNVPVLINNLYDKLRFESNVSELKREVWVQQQSAKKIKDFINRKKDVLLSTPSIWPVFGYITSGYGWRTNPVLHRKEHHKALDIYSIERKGAHVRATARGRIVVAGWAGSFGKIVIIDHGNGFSTRYAHCSQILVKQGQQVEQGEIIANVGSTGMSTGPHLHYEVRYKGKPVNPIRFVKGR